MTQLQKAKQENSNPIKRGYIDIKDADFKTREVDNEDGTKDQYVKGYAALFNSKTLLYKWGNVEVHEFIQKGFFDDVLEDDVRCLLNHESSRLLGRSQSGTLVYGVDDKGLWYECKLDSRNTEHSNLLINLERGDISQSSFAFTDKQNKETREEIEDKVIYTIELIKCDKLYDVSPVTYPAYDDTSCEARGKHIVELYATENETKTSQSREKARAKLNILKHNYNF